MHRTTALGVALSAAGIAGYAVGIYVAYPGRAFSITAVMVGVCLAVFGRRAGAEVTA
ncbi:MAG: hypothetical protein ABEH35_04040 [Haloarculaceae archaeon]